MPTNQSATMSRRMLANMTGQNEEVRRTENNDTVKDGTDSSAHRHARVLSLETDGREALHTTVREGGLGKDSPETEEAGLRWRLEVEVVGVEGRVAPVAEADTVVVRVACR